MPGRPFSWWGHHICTPLREFHSSTGLDRSSASYVPPWHGPSYACLQISRWLPLALGDRLVDHLCPRPRHRNLPRGAPRVFPGDEKPQYPPKLEGAVIWGGCCRWQGWSLSASWCWRRVFACMSWLMASDMGVMRGWMAICRLFFTSASLNASMSPSVNEVSLSAVSLFSPAIV